MNFVLKKQKEENVENQGVNLVEFDILLNKRYTDEEVINAFLKSNAYSRDCLHSIVKEHKSNLDWFLRQMFNENTISITDFQKIDKNQLVNFFVDFGNEDDWGDDRGDFHKLLDVIFEQVEEYNSFYLISKDWFSVNDNRIRNPEHWIYTYYFLVIWIDIKSSKLMHYEISYD